jgi:hypothetical protein
MMVPLRFERTYTYFIKTIAQSQPALGRSPQPPYLR